LRFYETYLLGREQIENRKSVIVTSETQLRCLGYKLYDVMEFAFDTETNTVDWCNADNPYFKIVGISISFGINDSYYIPIGHRFDPTPQLPLKTIVRHLRPAFERTDVTIIGANIKYDMHVMKRIGIEIKTPYIFDTMIASWLCNENVEKGLKPNVLRIFNHQMEKFNDVVAKVPKEIKKKAGLKANQKATFDLTMIGDSANYATEDAFFTFMLYLHYLEELEITGMTKIYYKMYPPFIRILYDMEERGITIDKEACAEMNEKMQEDIEDLEYQMLELVGVDFDINSSQQLAQLLFGYDGFKTVNQDLLDVNFGFPVQSRTAKGVPQTNNATLVAISRMEYKNSNKIMGVKFCNLLLKHKELSKLKTFTQKFLEVCYPDGKIHCSFNPVGTDSGRISCNSPNLMQIPNAGEDDRYNIRSLFVGDLDEYDQEDIISCDYSNLEVRVMAHFSKDEGLLNAFEHKVDLHGNTAKLMFRLDCDANEVKKKYPKFRKMGKVIAFLLQYGGSVMALESTLNSDGMLTEMLQELKGYKHKKDLPDTLAPFWGCKSTKEMAQSLMDLYFEAFPGIAKFMKRQKKYAHQHGKVYTVLGRERRLPQIQSGNFREVGYAERLALNAPIQGCQTYDTPILTTKGYKQISELDITKDVLVTHTGVTDDYNVYKTGDKEVYKLTTLNTIQKVTLDHRFCVYDNGELIFKRLKELQPGDYIVNGNYNNVTCNNKDVSIHEYIGALIGDGNYSSRNAMRLCGGKDKLPYLHLLKSFVEEHLDYKLTLRQSSGSKGACYEFTTENKQFRELCRSNGLHNASKQDKIIPSWYLTSDVYIKCSLLRGLFNTDGGFSKECLNYTSKSQQVAYSVHLLLNSLGIRSRYKEQKNGVYRVFVELDSYAKFNELVGFKVESKQQRLLSVMDRHSTSYAPINLCKDVAQLTYDENLHLQGKDCALRRKLYTKGGSLSSCIHLLQLCTSSKAQQLLGLIKGITFTKIVTTEYLGVLPTMDIEIFTEDHSYIASGLLNHNSGADIMINAQINIARSERLKELGCKMLVQIHDELLFSCPKENCDEAIKEIRECMIYPFGRDKLLNLALDIGASHGASYACGH
jgi:DNA polymerase I-like protein with 3'-5' exonuclease and polymerase domains